MKQWVLTLGGPGVVSIAAVPEHQVAAAVELQQCKASLVRAEAALRIEVERRAGRVERRDLPVADRRATR